MFKNYIKIAIRNMRKNKVFSIINILGLAVGIACCLIILLFVQFELSYENYHENRDNIYRIVKESINRETRVSSSSSGTPIPLAPALKSEFPEIVNSVRFRTAALNISRNNVEFNIEKISLADPEIFNMLTFDFVQGNHNTALKDPYTAVITESTSKIIFGDEDPVNKTISLNWRAGKEDYKITGIIKDIPINSIFSSDIYIPYLSNSGNRRLRNHWGNNFATTYIQLSPDYPVKELESKLPQFINKYI